MIEHAKSRKGHHGISSEHDRGPVKGPDRIGIYATMSNAFFTPLGLSAYIATMLYHFHHPYGGSALQVQKRQRFLDQQMQANPRPSLRSGYQI